MIALIYEEFNFIFTYVFCPLILTLVYLYQDKTDKDRGYFDIVFSIFMLYLVAALLYNYWTGNGIKYMVGLTAAMAVKEAVIGFDKGYKKNANFLKSKLNRF